MSVSGTPCSVDGNCSAILVILIADAGKDVDKERLMEAGWPDRLVHENSLAKAISRLRQALASDGEAIVAAYGYGYRLAAVVRPVEQLPAPANTAQIRND